MGRITLSEMIDRIATGLLNQAGDLAADIKTSPDPHGEAVAYIRTWLFTGDPEFEARYKAATENAESTHEEPE